MNHIDFADSQIPVLGFGTWLMEGEDAREGVRHAIEIGYRHIDTAQIYANEREVGEGIREAGVPREQILITTKVWRDKLGRDALRESVHESLRRLQTDYVDFLLIHWPNDAVPLAESLGAMMELREEGLIRHTGVSNFTPSMLREALSIDSAIATNQVEYHPFLRQNRLLEIVREHDLFLTAYSPVARGRVMQDEVIVSIAERHGKTPAQVALRWLIQQDGVVAIPKSSSPQRRAENIDVFDFELSDDEMRSISARAHPNGRLVDVGYVKDWEEG